MLRIDVLKELFAHMEDVKRALLDFSLGHGHGSGCAMCQFVLGDSTTVRAVNLPPSLKPSDITKTKNEMEDALCQYLGRKKHLEFLPSSGSLIIVMRPAAPVTTKAALGGLENIESSEDEMDFQEVFLDAIRGSVRPSDRPQVLTSCATIV